MDRRQEIEGARGERIFPAGSWRMRSEGTFSDAVAAEGQRHDRSVADFSKLRSWIDVVAVGSGCAARIETKA